MEKIFSQEQVEMLEKFGELYVDQNRASWRFSIKLKNAKELLWEDSHSFIWNKSLRDEVVETYLWRVQEYIRKDKCWLNSFGKVMTFVEWNREKFWEDWEDDTLTENLNNLLDLEEFGKSSSNETKEEIEEVGKEIADILKDNEQVKKNLEYNEKAQQRVENFYKKMDYKIENASNPFTKTLYEISKSITVHIVKNKNKDFFDEFDEIKSFSRMVNSEIKTFLNENNLTYSSIQPFYVNKENSSYGVVVTDGSEKQKSITISFKDDNSSLEERVQKTLEEAKKRILDFFKK